ncbi:MAG: hypothetical protein V4693_05915 [Pseudomonadota bacterium]
MNNTPNNQRGDVLTPGGDQKDMQDIQSDQIKQVEEEKGDRQEGASSDPQVSVPADMPKE